MTNQDQRYPAIKRLEDDWIENQRTNFSSNRHFHSINEWEVKNILNEFKDLQTICGELAGALELFQKADEAFQNGDDIQQMLLFGQAMGKMPIALSKYNQGGLDAQKH